MPIVPDVDFARIAPRGGSQDEAFEELCCQLALLDVPDPTAFRRVRGAGGDGGVECYWTGPAGEVRGWQVKYIFDFGRALSKVRASLATAMDTHPGLTNYVVCFPFDLSGSKGKAGKGKSQQEKFDEFKQAEEAGALAAGRNLTIELWSASNLRVRLGGTDPSGGRTLYWFDAQILGNDWFAKQVDAAVVRAGPRYQPKLHTGHALEETLAALAGDPSWDALLDSRLREVEDHAARWQRAVATTKGSSWAVAFPAPAREPGESLRRQLENTAQRLRCPQRPAGALASARSATDLAQACEKLLAADINTRHGEGMADSVKFRQFQAEYQCCFPAQHLDDCRELLRFIDGLVKWLASPGVRAAAERRLVLTGPAGIGKTHGLCDVAIRRRGKGLPTVLLSGGQFSGNRSVWESMADALGLDTTWSRDALLDALDSKGACPGRLLLCIDALDERGDRTRWRDDLPEVVHEVAKRPNLAVCVSVRDGYQEQVIRKDLDLPTFQHPGFGDAIFDACSSFFRYFDLDPPIGPLLEPEYANPLFLLVLCQTLKARGLRSVPLGWTGANRVLGRLLAARDDDLRGQHPGVGARVISASLEALADAVSKAGPVEWNAAADLVAEQLPASQRSRVDLLDHLVGIGLVRAVPGHTDGWTQEEDRIDIAFGRLRHHLVASRLTSPEAAADNGTLVEAALDDPGLAEALALVLPEVGRGELVDLTAVPGERSALLRPWLAALPWRASESLQPPPEGLLFQALRDDALEHVALDALLVLAMRPGQPFDHTYLHDFLSRLPMARRDRGWCWYLHQAFERTSPPSPLTRILRAPWESGLEGLAPPLREAWCVVLGWCGSAADLRVRDHAVKAAVRVTEGDPEVWAGLVRRFAAVDDENVVEGVLAAAYGALLRNPNHGALGALARAARDSVLRRQGPPPAHAVLRDLCRSIGDWAAHRNALPSDMESSDFQPPFDAAGDIDVPDAESLEKYKDQRDYPQIYASIMSEMTGDFAKYTMPRALGRLEEILGKEESRRWLLGEVIGLGYEPRFHAFYDHHMMNTYGHLGGRPAWAERIGKKYQRIALARLVGKLDDVARARGHAREELAGERLRRIDPSLLARGMEAWPGEKRIATWWAPTTMDFGSSEGLSDADWIASDDFPDPASLLQEAIDPSRPERRWRLLDASLDWENQGPRDDRRRYRFVWMHITGYLVSRSLLKDCVVELAKTDLFGGWLPEGFDIESKAYLGEYPWAPAFPELREPPDTWQVDSNSFARFNLVPLSNRLCAMTDTTMVDTVALGVPSAPIAQAAAVRWDGEGGFRLEGGRVVFEDPSLVNLGPSALMADSETLESFLATSDADIVWTVVAKRYIVGDDGGDDFCGQRHISAVVWREAGQLRVRPALGEYLRPDRTTIRG